MRATEALIAIGIAVVFNMYMAPVASCRSLRAMDDTPLPPVPPGFNFFTYGGCRPIRRDGQDRIGSGGAANYARRSPFPMINILRTNQVSRLLDPHPLAISNLYQELIAVKEVER